MYCPPAGGGGVQRPLKLATHLPALGIETHVLAPDDPKWLHRDEELRPPTQAFVHRARYLGPSARLPSEELHALDGHRPRAGQGAARLPAPAAAGCERHLGADRVPAAVRIVKRRGHRRRDHDQPAPFAQPDRRVGQATDRNARGSPTSATRWCGTPIAASSEDRAAEGEGARAGRPARGPSEADGSLPSRSRSPTRCAASTRPAPCA